MTSMFDYAAFAVAALIAIPAAIYMAPAIVVGLFVAALVGAYGSREALDVFKKRQIGAAMNQQDGQTLNQLQDETNGNSSFSRKNK